MLEAVRRVTAVRGNWFIVWDDHVEVLGADPTTLGLRIGGKCAFRARVEPRQARTVLRVGGLDRWTQSRNYIGGFIPAGLAHIEGFFMYKLFLQTVAAELAHLDPTARARIGSPSGATIT